MTKTLTRRTKGATQTQSMGRVADVRAAAEMQDAGSGIQDSSGEAQPVTAGLPVSRKVPRASAKLLLKGLRDHYASCRTFEEKQGFRKASLIAIERIELNSSPNELWSSSLDEAGLKDEMRIGEHIAVTRRALGFVP